MCSHSSKARAWPCPRAADRVERVVDVEMATPGQVLSQSEAGNGGDGDGDGGHTLVGHRGDQSVAGGALHLVDVLNELLKRAEPKAQLLHCFEGLPGGSPRRLPDLPRIGRGCHWRCPVSK